MSKDTQTDLQKEYVNLEVIIETEAASSSKLTVRKTIKRVLRMVYVHT